MQSAMAITSRLTRGLALANPRLRRRPARRQAAEAGRQETPQADGRGPSAAALHSNAGQGTALCVPEH